MKRILIVFSAALLMLWSCNKSDEPVQDELLVTTFEQDVPGQYVVLLKEGVTSVKAAKLAYNEAQELMRDEVRKVLTSSGMGEKELLHVYTSAQEGFAVRLTNSEVQSLKNNPGVLGIWTDRLVTVGRPVHPPTPLPAEVTPPGITMVGGGITYSGDNKVWIIDTGIDLTHPDLNVDVASGISYVPRTTTPDDDNGHGTHVAGIVAAIDNSVGVVGVAAGAKVVPVKVLDKRGSGYMSTIIKGVDYVAENGSKADAVNMSLGGGAFEPLDIAVVKLAGKGLFVSLAAGNEGDDANNHSPARANHTNIFTVSACDVNKNWAYFSNFGNPPVDFCAPGVSIRSLYKDGGMAIMSGTSMSAPHVCGILLLNAGKVHVDGYVSGDPDGNADPIAHR